MKETSWREALWRRHLEKASGGGIMYEELWRRHLEASWRRNHGGDIIDEESWRRNHGGGGDEGGIWEASEAI